MERRTQTDRDAITVEIGYAFVSACCAAALVFGAVYGPALLFALPHQVDAALLVTGGVTAAVAFALQATRVLWRFTGLSENDGG
ncbi:DUF6332 family protein [Streptomyces sp. NPDC058662]|uniref:DUF6332 family protein n=1 Tax=Streptomyces sp. NPDC058662 TaxID=3346583 RepID=UPI00365E4DAE